MRSMSKTVGLVSVAILLLGLGALLGRTGWSMTRLSLARPDTPTTGPTRVAKGMAPDKALARALSALADAKIELFDTYKIFMYRPNDQSGWGVWFVALPETPGMDVFVNIEGDGGTSILPGL
jgi:hypothetical protein